MIRNILPRRVLRRASNSIRALSNGEQYKHSDDEELLNSYSGFFPKLRIIKDLLTDPEGVTKVQKCVEQCHRLYSGPVGYFAVPIQSYIELQNPLLLKYDFNPVDFVDGVKLAFDTLTTVIDPSHYSEEEATDIYSHTMSPAVRNLFQDIRTSFIKSKKPLPNYSLQAIFLSRISTRIIPRGPSQNTSPEVAPLVENVESASSSTSESESEGKFSAGYTPGSVIASIDVQFVYSYDLEKTGKEKNESLDHIFWQFEGCISGQTELQWRLNECTFPMILLDVEKETEDNNSEKTAK